MRLRDMSVIVLAACAALPLLSCKGRTADNMQPNGETVEVVINTSAESADSPEAALESSAFPNESSDNEID